MLVFDEGCNRSDLWKKVHEKWEKIHILGNFRLHVPVHPKHVPVQFGFWSFFATMYRYRSDMYRYTLLCFDQCLYFSHNLPISYPI